MRTYTGNIPTKINYIVYIVFVGTKIFCTCVEPK